MNEVDLWENLKSLLLENISSAKPASGGKEIVMICNNPGCNDRSGHLYIGMNNGIPMYHCKKNCGNQGVVNSIFLNSLGLFDSDIVNNINNRMKDIKYQPRTNKNKQRIYTLRNEYISDNTTSQLKLAFINKRLGVQLTYEDLIKLKIVLNLNDLLIYNNIKQYTRDSRIVNELDSSFIGFISHHNGSINMRNLREGKVSKYVDKRYVNYNIFNDKDMERSYYTIPTQIGLNTSKRTLICLTEGPFDILSVYLNVRHQEPGIYYALQNNNYLLLIEYIMLTLHIFYCEVHIYRDLGVDMNQFTHMAQILRLVNIPVYLHTNIKEGEKDYGVSPDRIIDSYIQL